MTEKDEIQEVYFQTDEADIDKFQKINEAMMTEFDNQYGQPSNDKEAYIHVSRLISFLEVTKQMYLERFGVKICDEKIIKGEVKQ